MTKLNDFYDYLIKTALSNELSLSNLSKHFSFHRVIDSGINAKSYVNDFDPVKTFKVIYENNKVETILIYPKTHGLNYSIKDIKEYLNIEYKVFNNSREMILEFIFVLSQNIEIRLIVYRVDLPRDILIGIINNKPFIEDDIICNELEIRIK